MSPDPTYHALLQACQQPDCPVCTVALSAVTQYLRSLMYESVNDVPLREHLRASLGFCSRHNWLLLDSEVGNALGIAIIYNDVLTNILRNLPNGSSSNERGGVGAFFNRVAGKLSEKAKAAVQAIIPPKPCPACVQQQEADEMTVKVFVQKLGEEKMRLAFSQSAGLCLPHLRQVLPAISNPADLDFLLKVQSEKLAALQGELAEFIRKNDYHFQHEGFGAERDAWKRVINLVAGKPDFMA